MEGKSVEVGCARADSAPLISVATDEMYLPTLPAAARECYKFADKDI